MRNKVSFRLLWAALVLSALSALTGCDGGSEPVAVQSGTPTVTVTATGTGTATGTVSVTPVGCTGQNVTWTQNGDSCSAVAGATAHASVASVTNSASGFTGSANFTCTNGTLGAAVAPVCTRIIVEPQQLQPVSCTGQTLTWTVTGNTCSGATATTVSGSTTSVTNSTANLTGSATFACSNGAFGAAGASSLCAVTSTPSQPTTTTCTGKGC
jgi:hypothetical protein